jgi:hypothetical protein
VDFILIIFAANPAPYLSIVLGICGLGGLVFTALRYKRDDTTALVGQQNTIISEMKILNEENRQAATSLREERNELRDQVEQLTTEIKGLREELQKGQL